MNKVMTKKPAEGAEHVSLVPRLWQPMESLRKEVDRLFEDFDLGFWRTPRRSAFETEPFWRHEMNLGMGPAVDVVEHDKFYEITAELPGLDEKDVEVTQSEGMLTIKGEKKEEKEETKENFYVAERRYGSFERSFRVPESVDAEKVDATFKKGVLTLTLPKKPEAQHTGKKIAVKAA